MLLKYFYNQKLAHASYLVGCQATGEAIVIDPGRDIDIYLKAARSEGLSVTAVTETHIHADFVSGARELAEQVGACLFLSGEGGEEWQYQYLENYDHKLLKDGDVFLIGKIKFEVMHTPGHTPEHISFLLTDRGSGTTHPMGIFTGDFVFVGSVGRPDLLEKAAGMANTSVGGAKQMFESLKKFKKLPEYLQVWPGHGAGSACGKGLGSVPSSTVGYEKMLNPMLQFMFDEEEKFVEDLLSDQPETPKYFPIMKQVNKEGPAILNGIKIPEKLADEQIKHLLSLEALIIDTRPNHLYAPKHIVGTINIPSNVLAEWSGWFVDYDKPVYLITDEQGALEAARDFAYIGIDTFAGYFDLSVLETFQEELQSYYIAGPSEELQEKIFNDEVVLLDVRSQNEWNDGHLPNAYHLMLGYLRKQGQRFVNNKPVVVQCETGARSAIGASILQAMGANNVTNLIGGYEAWQTAGLPIEKD